MKIADKVRFHYITYQSDLLTEWEEDFIGDLIEILCNTNRNLTEKQMDKMREIYNKVRFIVKRKRGLSNALKELHCGAI